MATNIPLITIKWQSDWVGCHHIHNSIVILNFVKDYKTTDIKEISKKVVQELKDGSLHFAAEAPDKDINQPKALFVWRSNLFSSSGKGQEYFMKHILGSENGFWLNKVKTLSQLIWNGMKRVLLVN
jgi:Nitrate reductase alpha subunit